MRFPWSKPAPQVVKAAEAAPAPSVTPASAAPAPVYSPTVRDRQTRTLSRAIRPREVEAVLERALLDGDWRAQAELFDMMEDTWPRLTKNINEIKRSVSRLDYTVTPFTIKGAEPTPSAAERAEFVDSVLWSMKPDATAFEKNTEGMLYDLLDAHGKGISVVEVYWSASSAGIVPRAARQLPGQFVAFPSFGSTTQDRILFDPTGRYGSTTQLVPFQHDNFIVAVCQSRSGHPASTALLRSLAKYWIASQFGFQWLVNYAQLFGAPLRWATYDPNNKALLDDICAMLDNIGSTGWGAFPVGTTLEMKEPVGKAADNPQKLVMDIADKACDLLILGQTLTTDVSASGGSRALGDVHMSVRDDIMSAAADWLAGVLNTQLVPAILRLNYGDDTEAPLLVPDIKDAEDAKANAERDKILIGDLGLPVEKAWLYERHKIPQPASDADPETIFAPSKPAAPVMPPVPQVPPDAPVGAREVESKILIQARKAVERDRLADAVLERLSGVAADWLRPVRPVFADLIAKAMDASVTDADFIKALEYASKAMPELFDKLDADTLARAMEEAMGAAAVNGAVKSSRRI